jgi:hypothetical protein
VNRAPGAIVVLTGGTAGTCSQARLPEIPALAGSALSMGVKTQIIFFPLIPDASVLDSIAASGGTTRAQHVDPLAPGDVQVHALLMNLHSTLSACSYRTPDGKFLGSTAVVQVVDRGAPQPLPRLGDSVECQDVGGYYLEPDGTTFSLCPLSCSAISGTTARVEVSLGCGQGGSGTTGGGGAPPGSGGGGNLGSGGGAQKGADASIGGFGGFGGGIGGSGSGSPRCDGDPQCSPPTPFCHTTLFRCVECRTDLDCSGGASCDVQTGQCLLQN